MKQIKGMQLGAVLAAMLILIATIAVPVAVAETNTGTSTGTGCGTCGDQNSESGCGCCGDTGIISLTGQELNGSLKNKAVATALAYPEVKDIRQILLDKGFRPSVNDAMAMEITKVNETGTYNTTLVIIPYDREDGVQGSIIFGTGDEGTDAFYINGLNWDCFNRCAGAACIAAVLPCIWACKGVLVCSAGCVALFCGSGALGCLYACWE
ncbi:MAG: hypothetical protein SCH70_13755 [Candidatus Methanoperedens sp.]|nr:hypothetical protein [Candidatus Methanoperedens sp.]